MGIIRGSFIRLWRTPVKTVFFFLLLALTVALVCAGGNLWKLCGDNLERFEYVPMEGPFSTHGSGNLRKVTKGK